jgi:zinc transport system substrate-binding protein
MKKSPGKSLMNSSATSRRSFSLGALALLVPGLSAAAGAQRLKIGITLHPYYSFVASIVGDRADVVPLIDAEANPHGYTPQPGDMVRMTSMNVLVVNGIGHDTWAFEILDAAGQRGKLKLIHANDGVSLIPVAGAPAGEKVVNPHTFISTTAAIQQVYTIARSLGELDPANTGYFRAATRWRSASCARSLTRRSPARTCRNSAAPPCTAATTTSCRSWDCRSRP